MSNLVERLYNEHPNYSDAVAAGDKIQELQIDLNILKKAYHVLVKERDDLRAELESVRKVQVITDPAEIRRVFEIYEADYPPPDSGFAKL